MFNSPSTLWRNAKELHSYLGKKGKVIVATKIYVTPEGFDHEAPYAVALVELENGERKTLQVVDSTDDLISGQEVVCVIRRIGKVTASELIQYGIKVRPL